ncbi:hypothetical protein NC653_041025 [Populus alba x Populus x berolinensis]|uniref:Uncharacterized protein n=1 Tax=Populus alba x Populus x berolinensis TaxID=444605 RepID=A0AAD6L7H8_9ROSI|nr:hypothetical protein NC653_041025 [Populus alba x Populus x berolinensis]
MIDSRIKAFPVLNHSLLSLHCIILYIALNLGITRCYEWHLGSHLPSGVCHSSETFFCCVGVGFCKMSESGSSYVNDVTVYDVSGTHHRQLQTSYLQTKQSSGFWVVPL